VSLRPSSLEPLDCSCDVVSGAGNGGDAQLVSGELEGGGEPGPFEPPLPPPSYRRGRDRRLERLGHARTGPRNSSRCATSLRSCPGRLIDVILNPNLGFFKSCYSMYTYIAMSLTGVTVPPANSRA
jgi:hypothetical protein